MSVALFDSKNTSRLYALAEVEGTKGKGVGGGGEPMEVKVKEPSVDDFTICFIYLLYISIWKRGGYLFGMGNHLSVR